MSKDESKWNKKALEPETRAITDAWVKRTCPVIYIAAPSKVGKTTLLGTLLTAPQLHSTYCPVFGIDGDQGFATIDDFADPKLVTLHSFNEVPDRYYPWTAGKLHEAQTAKCGAIMYEGLTSVFEAMFAQERFANLGAKGNAARRLHIQPSSDLGVLLTFIREIKQYRIAKETGVPIFVSVNCKEQSVDNEKPDGPKKQIPAMSVNLTRKAQGSADAFLELTRSPSGTRLITTASETSPFAALRYDKAAALVQRELNLSLPGLLALWATTIHNKKTAVSKHLHKSTKPAEKATS